MADYRTMFDDKWLRAWDLGGTDVTLTIEKVEAGEMANEKDKTSKRVPFVYFKGFARPLGLNKTNARSIAGMYGPDTAKWIGKRVTLYPTTTEVDSVVRDCIRVRPGVPADDADRDDLLARRADEPKRGRAA